MGLVGHHGKAATLQRGGFLNGLEHKWEGLDGDDDDRRTQCEGASQLGRLAAVPLFAVDAGDDAIGMFKLGNGLLQLAIEHGAVGNDDHRIKLLLAALSQRGELMGQPGDGVGFAGACGVLDQILLATAFVAHGTQQALHHIPLVIAGEDQALFFLDAPQIVLFMLHMQVHVAGKDFQQGLGLQYFLPQIFGAIAGFRLIIPGTAVTGAAVKGQKVGALASELGGHRHLELVDREMDQGPAPEGQQRLHLAGCFQGSVLAVLLLGVFQALLEAGFQLQRRNRQAV